LNPAERANLPTILLVEDDASDATLLCRAFERAKVLNPVVHLTNGDDALAYLAGVAPYTDRSKFPLPALILLDLKLPGMTGLQLLQWKRTQNPVRRIPVVVLTSDEDPATVDAAYDLGANSYLRKQSDPAQITRMVDAIQRYWIELNEPPQLVILRAKA
jgi:CheY-like chemotaxis protein